MNKVFVLTIAVHSNEEISKEDMLEHVTNTLMIIEHEHITFEDVSPTVIEAVHNPEESIFAL